MKKLGTIILHSVIDVITNSSTEIFTFDTDLSEILIRDMLREKCEETDEMDWFNNELTVTQLDNNRIELYSFLNEPDWIYDWLKQFENLSYD